MTILKTISSHPDIYDALTDHHNIELLDYTNHVELIDAIDCKMDFLNLLVDNRDDEHHVITLSLNERIANLAMIKGFIDVIIDCLSNNTKTP